MDVSSDGLSMTVVWKKNYAGWLGWLANPILPQHYFASLPIDQTLTQSMPVGPGIEKVPWSGPFVITDASSDGIDYARNTNYKGRDHQAYLDTLRFKFYGSKDGEIAAFLNGEVDLAFDLLQPDYPAIQGVDPSIGTAELDPAWQYEHFDLNNADSANGLDDVNVRKAIAMAVDKQDLINVLFPGQTLTPACSPAPPGTWWRIETTCPAFDVAASGAALDAAGWTLDENGIRAKGGDTSKEMRMQLCTTSGNPTRLTELSKLSSYLSAVGIPSDISTADASSVVFAGWADTTPTTQCSIYRGTYSIADFAYVLGGDLYSNYYYTYASSQIPSDKNPNGSNDTRIQRPRNGQGTQHACRRGRPERPVQRRRDRAAGLCRRDPRDPDLLPRRDDRRGSARRQLAGLQSVVRRPHLERRGTGSPSRVLLGPWPFRGSRATQQRNVWAPRAPTRLPLDRVQRERPNERCEQDGSGPRIRRAIIRG